MKTFFHAKHFTLSVCTAALFVGVVPTSQAVAQASAHVSIEMQPANKRSTVISSDFTGLSFEAGNATSVRDGLPELFSMTNTKYVQLFKTLGVKSLRIGGATAEKSIDSSTLPTLTDAKTIEDFCNATGANLIWTLPTADYYTQYGRAYWVDFAESMVNYRSSKGYQFHLTFAIGNEPDVISGEPESYATWSTIFDLYIQDMKNVIGEGNFAVSGPQSGFASPQGGGGPFVSDFLADTNNTGTYHSDIRWETAHIYPAGLLPAGYGPAVAALLSPSTLATDVSMTKNFVDKVSPTFVPRLDETNNAASDNGPSGSQAAALVTLDRMAYYATQTPLSGMNFHTAYGCPTTAATAGYDPIVPACWNPSGTTPAYQPMGDGYGMLAFTQLGGGYPVPLSIANQNAVNLTAYSVITTGGTSMMAIVNKTSTVTQDETTATLFLDPGKTYTGAKYMLLQVPDNNPSSYTGFTLGGTAVASDGTWSQHWTIAPPPANGTSGAVTVTLPAASAMIVQFY